MKKILISAVALMATTVTFADENEAYVSPITGQPFNPQGQYTLEQIKARDERVLEKTGGFVEIEAKGVSVLVLDTRQKPGGSSIQFQDVFASLSKTNVKVDRKPLEEGEIPLEKAIAMLAAEKAAYAIVIIEDGNSRGLSVYPEDRIAIINANRYKGGNDPLRPEVRVHKEIWRALGFVSGVGYAPFENDVMQPVFSVRELDAQQYQVMQPMNFQKMYSTLAKFGIKRNRRVPYRVAVQEGWAPAPTNEVQRAIWDKVHAIPKNPMKIEFDPMKGR